MASQEEIAELRLLINEPDDSNDWTDERLGAIIDDSSSLNEAAGTAWTQKAASYADLVDVSESGSSRKLSDLRRSALEMAGHFNGLGSNGAVGNDGPVISRIRRGFA